MNEQTDSCELLNSAFNSVIEYLREFSPEEIDDAYDFFWEEEDPEDILGGTALGIAFINFEDWLVCDYRRKAMHESLIDVYIKEKKPDGRTASLLAAMRDSVLSVYRIKTIGEGSCTVEDMLIGGEPVLTGSAVPKLRAGDIFGGRVFQFEGRTLLGRGVYPFNEAHLDRAKVFLDKELKRYMRKHPEGTLRQMLKDEAYYMNVVWLNCLLTRKKS